MDSTSALCGSIWSGTSIFCKDRLVELSEHNEREAAAAKAIEAKPGE